MYAPDDPHMWPADALERVAAAIENLTAEEARVGLESTEELEGVSSPLPEVSDNVIRVDFGAPESEQDRMTGGPGDRFRTDAAQDEFRRRYNTAMERLHR